MTIKDGCHHLIGSLAERGMGAACVADGFYIFFGRGRTVVTTAEAAREGFPNMMLLRGILYRDILLYIYLCDIIYIIRALQLEISF